MIKIYSTDWCPECVKLKKYLDMKGIEYKTINVADKQEDREEVIRVSNQKTVPVLESNGKVIVGFKKVEIDKLLGV